MPHTYTKMESFGKMDKRKFFRKLVAESTSLFDELCGKTQCRLTDLWSLPSNNLSQIIPKMLPDVEIIITENHISAKRIGKTEIFVLFDQKPENIMVFNQFNGKTTIGQIVSNLSDTLSFEEEKAYEHVRELFLRLVHLRVCLPNNPIQV